MLQKTKSTLFILPAIIIATFLVVAIIYAWTEPSASPPSNNVPPPINVGPIGQPKQGNLMLNTDCSLANGLLVPCGNVGIGTTEPGAKLDVRGQIIGGFGAMTTSGTLDWNDATNARSGGGYTLLMGNATNGPGPAVYFHPFNFEYSSKDGSGNITQLAIPYANSIAIDQSIYVRGRYSNSWTGWTKIIKEDRLGNVGIGTTAPSAKLEVAGQIKITGGSPGAGKVLTSSDASGLASWQTPTGGTAGSGTVNYVPKWTATTTLGNSQIFDNGTNVGIGTTSPVAKLDIRGYTYINPRSGFFSAPTIDLAIGDTDTGLKWISDGNLAVYTNNAERIRINSSGNVGIGTVTLRDKLTVNGNIVPPTANTGQVGTATYYWSQMNAAAYYYRSDQILKTNIKPINNSLEKISNLTGIYFNWKDSGEQSIGITAQEVERFFPEAVATDKNSGLKSVDYAKLVAPLIEAIKEQQKEIEELKMEIEELKGK